MCTWKQGVLFLAGPDIRERCVFISDVEICGIYLSLTLTAKLNELDESCSFYYIYHVFICR